MADTYKIAVASSDGIVVNQHFGHADSFYIYQVTGDDARFTGEVRKVEPVCHMGNHDDGKLSSNMKQLSDCKYLLVQKIGAEAASIAESLGISPYEIPDIIDKAINKLLSYEKVKSLFTKG